jgi:hypothetical protein
MTSLRIIDSHLVSDAEFFERGLPQYLGNRGPSAAVGAISLRDGASLDLRSAPPPLYTMPDGTTPLPPIGFGQPMTVDIRHVYTGHVGVHTFFDGNGDIAVVSGVKNWGVFKASARALNFVARGKGPQTTIKGADATTDGTPIVAYQRAVVSSQVTVSVEIAAAGNDAGLTAQLGSAFTAAGGIPLLLPYQGILLAAGQLLPLLGKLANAISGGATPWSERLEINFGLPGTVPSAADFRLLTSNPEEHAGYVFKAGVGLVDANGTAYSGDEPYAVLAIYGGIRSELESFAPTVAGADLLSRFYSATSGGGALLNDLTDILKLASDMKFRAEALDLERQITDAGNNAELTGPLQAQLKAVLANIKDASLKPPITRT